MKKLILPALAIFVLLGGLIMAFLATRENQDIRKKAATPTGTTSIVLNPGTSSLTAGSSATISLTANTGSLSVDGFQVIATVSGTIPSDLQFTPSVPAGMQQLINSFSTGTTRTLKLAYVTQNTQVPFSAGSATLGQFTFTVPATGAMTITFDNDLTKISQNQTSQDVLLFPTPATYTFQASATASPGASASPAPTATPGVTTCTRGNQSISLTPSSQSGNRGQALTYTVTVKNNDDKNCEKANFTLSAILPFANWTANFAQTVLSIAPQASGSTTVNFTSSTNSPLGDLPVGVNSVGPKSGVVAAATYKVQAPTATPRPTTQTVIVPGQTVTSPTPVADSSISALPTPDTGYVAPAPEEGGISALFSSIPQNYLLIGLGVIIFAIVLWLLGKIFGKKDDNNPPQMTPPTTTTTVTETPIQQAPPTNIAHGIEPPIPQQ